PRALQPGQQDHGRRPPEREPGVARAHERRELLVDDLHDLLARREALQDVLAERALLDRRREVSCDLEVDVGLEQGEADLPHRLRDRPLVEATAATQAAESRLQLVGKRVEHGRTVYAAPVDVPAHGRCHERLLHSSAWEGPAMTHRELPTGTVTL